MKKHLLALALFVSSTAFACPDLTGDWTCKGDDGKETKVSITQEAITNGMLYHLTADGQTEDVHADGTARAFTKGDFTGTMTTTCMSSIQLASHVDFANASMGLTGKADISVELTTPNTMSTTTNATYSIGGGADQVQNSTEICTK